jgi:polyhydroxyalkanoate synthesis regulator phasin
MAIEEITVSRAYVSGLNEEIAALKKQVAQLKQELAAARAAQAQSTDCGTF